MVFTKATRHGLKIRFALCGPTGSGKTFTALGIAATIAASEGGRVAVIDTERSSADRYADKFDFDSLCLESFAPENYIKAIEAAQEAKYPVLVIDSLSHAWDGQDGLLEKVDMIAQRKGGNSFNAWGSATPIQRRMVDTILAFPGHVIVTMRSKMEYVQEKADNGKTTIKKVGLAPVQRQGIEYEFDLVGEIDTEHVLIMTKSRAADLADKMFPKPGRKFAEEVLAWANGGVKATAKTAAPATAPEPQHVQEPVKLPAPALRFFTCAVCRHVVTAYELPETCPKCPSRAFKEYPSLKEAQSVPAHTAEPKPPVEPPASAQNTPAQSAPVTGAEVANEIKLIRQLVTKAGCKNLEEAAGTISILAGREVKSSQDLTAEERKSVIEGLHKVVAEREAGKEAA
jgi:rubrerythrin